MALVPGVRLGPYAITAQIGVGGWITDLEGRVADLSRRVEAVQIPGNEEMDS